MNYAPLLAVLFVAWGVLFGGFLWTWFIFRRRWTGGWGLNFAASFFGALAAQAIGLQFATTNDWYRHLAWPAAGAVVAAIAGRGAIPASLPALFFSAVLGFEVCEQPIENLLIVFLPATAWALSQVKLFPLRAVVALAAVALPYVLDSRQREQITDSEREIYVATLTRALEDSPLAAAFSVPPKVDWGVIEFPEDAWGKPVCKGTTKSGTVVFLNGYGIVSVDFQLAVPLKMHIGSKTTERVVDPVALKKNGLNPNLFQKVTADLPPGRSESVSPLGGSWKGFSLYRNGNLVAILYLRGESARIELLGRAHIKDGTARWTPVYE